MVFLRLSEQSQYDGCQDSDFSLHVLLFLEQLPLPKIPQ